MTRVLHVIAGLQLGGAEHALLRLLTQTSDVEHVGVVSVLGDGPMRPAIETTGVRVVLLGAHHLRAMVAVTRGLRRTISDLHPDVIQSWMYPADLLATVTAGSTPVVWGVRHGHLPGPEAARATRLAGRVLASGRLQRPSGIIYNSHEARRAHEAAGYPAEGGHVIHNGIEVPTVEHAGARRRLHDVIAAPDDRPLVIRVGRHNLQKDHAGLLTAWASLPTTTTARLVLVGPGVPEAPAVQAAIANAHPDRPIHALGAREDARELVAGADLAVSNSIDGESFPNVVAEAIGVGTPVLATDVGDTRQILDAASVLLPPGNPAALADALADALARPRQRCAPGLADAWAPATEAARFSAVWTSAGSHP